MKIGIVGSEGVVGKALSEGFKHHRHTVYENDIDSGYSKLLLARECDLIFICVPTPCKKNGEINLKYVYKVAEEFSWVADKSVNPVPPLVIKSTVIPCTTDKLNELYSPKLHFLFNPEFLTAKTAVQDFLHPDRTVIGVSNPNSRFLPLLHEAYRDFGGDVVLTSPVNAELIKYFSNIFLVAKVAYCLEFDRVCHLLGADGKAVSLGVGLDRRIGDSHLNPVFGKIAPDSPCLPKDMRAFLWFLKKNKIKSKLLNEILECGIKK